MYRVLGHYVCLKVSGMLSSTCCLGGQIGILANEKNMRFIRIITYHDTANLGVSKAMPHVI